MLENTLNYISHHNILAVYYFTICLDEEITAYQTKEHISRYINRGALLFFSLHLYPGA